LNATLEPIWVLTTGIFILKNGSFWPSIFVNTIITKEPHKAISWLVRYQLLNAYVSSKQNFYCKSASYKGPFQNSSPDFWNKTLLILIFATP